LRDGLERGHEIRENGKAFSVGRLEEEARERVSLLVVALRVARNWLQTRSTEALCFSLLIVNVLVYEITLESGFHGQVVTRPSLSPRRVAACCPRRSTSSPVRRNGHGCRTLAPDTGHRTPDADTGRGPRRGHRTLDARTPDARTLDTCRTPDTGRAEAGHADGGGQGEQGTVDIRTSWRHDAAGTANRVAVGSGSTRGARQP
jgi:hypothetical protein